MTVGLRERRKKEESVQRITSFVHSQSVSQSASQTQKRRRSPPSTTAASTQRSRCIRCAFVVHCASCVVRSLAWLMPFVLCWSLFIVVTLVVLLVVIVGVVGERKLLNDGTHIHEAKSDRKTFGAGAGMLRDRFTTTLNAL